MPARDKYRDAVRNAFIKDGWTITHDPLRLQWDDKDLYVTTAGERLIAAEKHTQNIAVEVVPCLQPLPDDELERSMDLLAVYRSIIAEQKLHYVLHLALPEEVYLDVSEDSSWCLILEKSIKNVLVFNPVEETITQWIS